MSYHYGFWDNKTYLLTYFFILSSLLLCYVLFGSFCRIIKLCLYAVPWRIFSILSCFCLYLYYISRWITLFKIQKNCYSPLLCIDDDTKLELNGETAVLADRDRCTIRPFGGLGRTSLTPLGRALRRRLPWSWDSEHRRWCRPFAWLDYQRLQIANQRSRLHMKLRWVFLQKFGE